MPRKISEKEKKEIISDFTNGYSIDGLTKKFKFSKITISRHLKKHIDHQEYKELLKKNNNKNKEIDLNSKQKSSPVNLSNNLNKDEEIIAENLSVDGSFIEIAPLNYQIDNVPQKDLSSIPISDVDFPKVVYMIVDKNIELKTKYLREYPEWQFLSHEELNRKTIQIFEELKEAKRHCNREQKVIKVPNTNVFKITAELLLNKGISRIVSADNLIAL